MSLMLKGSFRYFLTLTSSPCFCVQVTSGETIFDKVPALSESCKMGCIGGLFYNVNARPKRCFATGLFVIVSFDLLPEDNSENLRES